MRIHSDNFVLIHLEGADSFVFEFFPKEIQSTDRCNWEPQDISRGVKPLFYSNSEPRRIQVPELMLAREGANESIGDQIDALRLLKTEDAKLGRPPALLAVWGDRQQRCVMEECTITESFFTRDGNPLRARVSLQLVELQEDGTAVSSTVKEVVVPDPIDSGSGIGDF